LNATLVSSLRSLKSAHAKKRKKILQTSDKGFYRAIGESAKNCLKGNVPLNRTQFRSLKKRRTALRKLANKKTSIKVRKQILQRGGFLGSFLGPVLKAIGGIFGL
jgi:ribosomal protein L20